MQLEEKRDARVGTLSGGQKQRLALACALVGDPELLFLDEPTTGLDPQSRRQLWELIESFRAAGRTILLTTHYMDEAERLCDRVAIMDHGRVIALGTPRALIAAALRRASRGVRARVGEGRGGRGGAARAPRRAARCATSNGGWQLEVTELHRAVPALLAELERRQRGAQRAAHALGHARGCLREAHREASPR